MFWLGFAWMVYKIVDDTTCVFGNHVFMFGKKDDICQKCGLTRRKVKSK